MLTLPDDAQAFAILRRGEVAGVFVCSDKRAKRFAPEWAMGVEARAEDRVVSMDDFRRTP